MNVLSQFQSERGNPVVLLDNAAVEQFIITEFIGGHPCDSMTFGYAGCNKELVTKVAKNVFRRKQKFHLVKNNILKETSRVTFMDVADHRLHELGYDPEMVKLTKIDDQRGRKGRTRK